ncbi:MAG: RNA polymerase sigma factor [Bacteroidales bacterium]|nr:RNA polymerase sigma factor [Bacteroidales bacterium]
MTQTIHMIHRDLIIACQKGDRKAFKKLYNLYAKAMYNVCVRFMHDNEGAKDMLQDAFSYAFSKIHSFRFESSFGSWLKRIAINTCISEIRKRKADLQFFEDMNYFDNQEEERIDERLISVDGIKEAMKTLPEGSRIIFNMYLLEGLDHGEIAGFLGINEATSRSQYMRAKTKVKEYLMHHEIKYQV